MKLSKYAKASIIAPMLLSTLLISTQPQKASAETEYTFDASLVSVLNNTGKNDYITISELSSKDKVAIYSDSSMKKKIYSKTVSGSTLKFKTKLLKDTGGAIYVSVKHSWKSTADLAEVTYNPSPDYTMPLQNTSTLSLTSIKDAKDIFTVTKTKKNATYRIYEDQAKKKQLASATAKSTADLQISVEIPKDYSLKLPQTVYVTVQEKGKKESTAIAYTSIDPEGPAPLKASQVTITNNKNYADVIKITGIQPNDMITIRSTTYPVQDIVTNRKSTGTTMYIYVDQLSKKSKTLEIIHTPATGANNPKSLFVKYSAEK